MLVPVRRLDVRSGGGCREYGWIKLLDGSNACPRQGGHVHSHPLYRDRQGAIVAQGTEVGSHRVQGEELYVLGEGQDTGATWHLWIVRQTDNSGDSRERQRTSYLGTMRRMDTSRSLNLEG